MSWYNSRNSAIVMAAIQIMPGTTNQNYYALGHPQAVYFLGSISVVRADGSIEYDLPSPQRILPGESAFILNQNRNFSEIVELVDYHELTYINLTVRRYRAAGKQYTEYNLTHDAFVKSKAFQINPGKISQTLEHYNDDLSGGNFGVAVGNQFLIQCNNGVTGPISAYTYMAVQIRSRSFSFNLIRWSTTDHHSFPGTVYSSYVVNPIGNASYLSRNAGCDNAGAGLCYIIQEPTAYATNGNEFVFSVAMYK